MAVLPSMSGHAQSLGPETRRPHLRAGRRHPAGGGDRPAGDWRSRTGSAGAEVLINGAGGGGGTFAVQLAKLDGAEVTAVDNTGKLDFMRSLGADHVIDYTREDFTRNGQQYDLILDLIAYRSAFCLRAGAEANRKLFRGRRLCRDIPPDFAPRTMDQMNHGQAHTRPGSSTQSRRSGHYH